MCIINIGNLLSRNIFRILNNTFISLYKLFFLGTLDICLILKCLKFCLNQ